MSSLSRWLFLLAFAFLSWAREAEGQDTLSPPKEFTKVRVKEERFQPVLFADPSLMAGLLDVKRVDGKLYLISVGSAVNKFKKNPVPKSFLDSMIVARQNAKANVAKFIETKLYTETTFIKETEKVTKTTGGKVERTRRVRTTLKTFTKEESLQLIHSPERKELGWWISADENFFYLGIAFPLPD